MRPRLPPFEVDAGLERVTLNGRARDSYRWWLVATLGRYKFARGGRADSPEEARDELATAYRLAESERLEIARRPTHWLAPNGDLVPIEKLRLHAPELEA